MDNFNRLKRLNEQLGQVPRGEVIILSGPDRVIASFKDYHDGRMPFKAHLGFYKDFDYFTSSGRDKIYYGVCLNHVLEIAAFKTGIAANPYFLGTNVWAFKINPTDTLYVGKEDVRGVIADEFSGRLDKLVNYHIEQHRHLLVLGNKQPRV